MFEILLFGFSQGFIIGPLSLFGIREGLDPKKGLRYQMQVILGGACVDFVYLVLATYGIAQFVNHEWVRFVMWIGAAYLLMKMGVNAIHERQHQLSFHHMHRHRSRFLETDFVKAVGINLLNPLAIVFWVMVAGSLYISLGKTLHPFVFAATVAISSFMSSCMIAAGTWFLRHIFHQRMLQRLTVLSSFILIGYGLWFWGKAMFEFRVLAFG